MEKFLSKIKKFTDLLRHLFDVLLKKFSLLFFSVFFIFLSQLLLIFLINISWLRGLVRNTNNFSFGLIEKIPILIMISGVVLFLTEVWKFSAVSVIKNNTNDIKEVFIKSFILIFRIFFLVVLLSLISTGFLLLRRSPRLIIFAVTLLGFLLILLSSYVSLEEKRKGVGSLMRAMHLWRNSFLKSLWKIFIFLTVFLLFFIAVSFLVFLIFTYLIQLIIVSVSYVFGVIITIMIVFPLLVSMSILFYLYFSLLSENIYKIRKYVVFYEPNNWFVASVYTFLSLILFIIIIGLAIF